MSDSKDQLTEKQQEELLQKYDSESNTRKLAGTAAAIVFIGLLAFSLFQLYTGAFGQYTAYIQRTVHLGFALSLIFLLFPARKKGNKKKVAWYDYLLVLLSIIVCGYWPVFYETLVQQIGSITQVQMFIGGAAILLVLEATRRAVGLPITIIAIIFLVYALFGPYMPGMLAHRGLSLQQLIDSMFFTTQGILGTPLQVSSTYIFLFLLFGAFLVQTGVGNYFNDLAISLAGRRTGGPAKVAIFSSALNGTISGSSVANTVTTGSYTIPMMKKLGYKPNFAGAVEAASSTGGQIMPPIMGAAAFLMIEFAGVGYWEIAKAATIPAILYFSGIWIMTHLEAKRTGLHGLPKDQIPPKKEVFKKIHLLLPIIAIVWLLFKGFSIERTALLGIGITILVSMFRKDTRINLSKFITALTSGARTALGVAAATACAGIIVGVVTKTGLGLKLGNSLVSMAGSLASSADMQLLLTLFFTMVASIILGMGSPTTANYIITSTIALPAILALNDQLEVAIPVLAGHMFVFYFGIVADITPPVALAAFAATGISGGEPIRTGVNAAKLAVAAFIIPYMFVLQPQLLMIDTTVLSIIWILFTAITGMIAIGAGLIGFWYLKLNWLVRIISVVVGLMLIYPEGNTDIYGLIAFIIMIAVQFMMNRSQGQTELMQQASEQ
ncbi:MAG: TRAP transporter permease [Bacillota bacterium]|uniref:TRAP transporter permease n=1 Tax=Virgibacillus salarius TaxID=447199 RepID=A0A941IAR3_9BACI|nr:MULTISPECIES: TRAP transporter permease [Bacillaceae]NAZ10937.1 TRAP transporter fused permease subunit [Agaribacter marinus]MBR7798229.1 TRAP transporter permease [Virgibacillus salarius]MCC2252720.1 TRAP transporter permease [Virgibacillus sp. AGTR]MDY7046706.1 TRAP transporter permease [Virgibacillus sp. M23]QRZ18640.1 TRAP transporter permease [Virgibacillus sp. AGTR]